ncbi:MAG: uracil-DNA glycosylase family protein [Spirochaetia bacterium]
MSNKDYSKRLQGILNNVEDFLRTGKYRSQSPNSQSGISTEPKSRKELLRELSETVHSCRLCKLGSMRENAVPGEGVLEPVVMCIGEAPGGEEDKQGRPFVGPAGQYLDKWLEALGLARNENVFITNIVKCRPPGNRDPQPDEVKSCIPYLKKQIQLIQPKTILALGMIATQILLDTTEGITMLHGKVFFYDGIPLVPTFHPSAVLRNKDELRRPVWKDLQVLKGQF